MGVKRFLEGGNGAVDGAVPDCRRRRALPERVRSVQDGLVPVKSTADAAVGLQCCGPLLELLSDEVVRIPELADARVRDARHDAGAGRFPIGGENGFPDGENAEFSAAVFRQ